MELHVEHTSDEKYYLHDDSFDKGMLIPVNVGVEGELKRCYSASYLIVGRIILMNPTRPDRVYYPNNVRIGLGVAFPGKHRMKVLEDSEVRCFHLSKSVNREDYDILEVLMETGETLTLTQSNGVEGGAVMIGSVKDADDNTLSHSTLFDVRGGDLTLIALEPTTVVYAVRLNDTTT